MVEVAALVGQVGGALVGAGALRGVEAALGGPAADPADDLGGPARGSAWRVATQCSAAGSPSA